MGDIPENPVATMSSPLPSPNNLNNVPTQIKAKWVPALYIHIPFCFHKCHYCDFFTVINPSPKPDRADYDHTLGHHDPQHQQFLERLLAELETRAAQCRILPRTIFVGGGTPTLLHPRLWTQLLRAFANLNLLTRVCEFTVEANPETVTRDLADVMVAGGVSRISIGAQSFDKDLLKALGRWHEPQNVVKAVRVFHETGIRNINLDLIFAIPGQTLEMLDRDIDRALRLNPDHLSCYNLTYEPNTALTQLVTIGRVHRAQEDLERRMYSHLIDRLEREGFRHYEVSNWARPGKKCAHNLMYWTNRNWLGVGPAAATHIEGSRWKNLPNLARYLAERPEPPTSDHEHLPSNRAIGEALMLRLRIRSGVPLSWLRRNVLPTDDRWPRIDHLLAIGMLERDTTHLRLTHKGLLVADSVIAEFL